MLTTYFLAPQYRGHVKFVTAILGGAAAIYSAYYIGAAMRLGLLRDKQKSSFDMLDMLNRPEFVEVREFVEEHVENHVEISARQLYAKITEDRDLLKAATIVLGIFEDMSIAIQREYAEEEILYLSLSRIVPYIYGALRPYIEQVRELKNEPRYHIEVEKLVQSWNRSVCLCSGKATPSI